MSYNSDNIFAKILKGEIPCQKIFENDYALAFHDKFPKAPVHALVITKGYYLNFHDFSQKASSEEIVAFNKAIKSVIQQLGLEEKGYRLISNCGEYGGQEVPHYHVHICSGKPLGPLLL
ncbi:MAG: HIT domain-containing protein [Proteobacteria bacterium]|nr:HIT domain-containing protein [Pseudomonadota bacterium]